MARQRLLDYDDQVRYLTARVRADYGAHVGDQEWDEDIRRLVDAGPEFAELWARHEVAGPEVCTRRFDLPRFGRVTLAGSELEVGASPGLRINMETPVDARTRAVLESLAEIGLPREVTVGA